MDAPLWLSLTVGCTLAGATTLGACHWWFGRRLAELTHQLAKLDKARQFASLQAAQARKQIEKLQTELVAQQRNLSRAHASKHRVEQLDIILGAADTATAGMPPPLPGNGFADTLPMAETGGH